MLRWRFARNDIPITYFDKRFSTLPFERSVLSTMTFPGALLHLSLRGGAADEAIS